MAKTYTIPWVTGTDKARFHLQDKTSGAMILEDEEIAELLTDNGWNDGLSSCAMSLAAYWAQQAAMAKAGEVQKQYAAREKFYLSFAEKARAGAIPQPDSPVRVVSGIAVAQAPRTDGTDLL